MWKETRVRPARTDARIPWADNRSMLLLDVTYTIGDAGSRRPILSQNRRASRMSCASMTSTPISAITLRAASVPTQENHAGDVSIRRAVFLEIRLGNPKRLLFGSSVAHQPACNGTNDCRRSLPTAMNALPRGESSHLYAWHT